jgi:hypothetical protein
MVVLRVIIHCHSLVKLDKRFKVQNRYVKLDNRRQ